MMHNSTPYNQPNTHRGWRGQNLGATCSYDQDDDSATADEAPVSTITVQTDHSQESDGVSYSTPYRGVPNHIGQAVLVQDREDYFDKEITADKGLFANVASGMEGPSLSEVEILFEMEEGHMTDLDLVPEVEEEVEEEESQEELPASYYHSRSFRKKALVRSGLLLLLCIAVGVIASSGNKSSGGIDSSVSKAIEPPEAGAALATAAPTDVLDSSSSDEDAASFFEANSTTVPPTDDIASVPTVSPSSAPSVSASVAPSSGPTASPTTAEPTGCFDEVLLEKTCFRSGEPIPMDVVQCVASTDDWIGIYSHNFRGPTVNSDYYAWKYTCQGSDCGGTNYRATLLFSDILPTGDYKAFLVRDTLFTDTHTASASSVGFKVALVCDE